MNNEVHYLKDKPCGIDKFAGQSQEHLSTAIANHIIENDSSADPMPRIIGIEGTWGSGKSNVVKLIEKHLTTEKKYYFFEYNAWGNQEDLQRRSILEQLTDCLVKNEILVGKTDVRIKGGRTAKKDWKEKLQLLLSRKTETVSESHPKLSGGLVFAFLAGILTPITSVVSNILGEQIPWYYQVCFAVSPIILVVILWLIMMLFDKKYRTPSFLLSIYSDKSHEEHSFEVISEDEPSVVEFKNWMQDVSSHLNHKKYDKLVIVFDNMDRLPADKVKQLWSSIHTFFAETGFDNIWVIIPYDKKHLSCAFGAEDPDKRIKLTQYFIDKTFPVTFDVPKPVITDYKGIFDSLLHEAFGDTISKEKAEIVNRLYRLCNPVANIREIITLINRLVSLYKTRNGEEIDIVSMAIYELYKEEFSGEGTVSNILSGDYLGDALKIVTYNDTLKAEISALVYGVSIDIAKQIPLTEYIGNCIDKTDGYDINHFAETDGNFDSILKEVFDSTDDAKLTKEIECLHMLKRESEVVTQLWHDLSLKQLKLSVDSLEIPKEYTILFNHVDQHTKKNLSNKLCASWFAVKDFNGSQYVECINKLKVIDGVDQDLKLKDKIVTPEIFVDAVGSAKENYAEYKLTCSEDAVDEYLSSKLPNEFTYSTVVETLFNSKFSTFEKTFLNVKHAISNEEVTDSNAGQIFSVFRLLATEKTKLLKEFMTERKVTDVIDKLEADERTSLDDGYIDLCAWSIAKGVDITFDNKYIPDVAKVIDFYIETGDLIIESAQSSMSQAKALVQYIIENKLGKALSFEDILPNYNLIRSRHDKISVESLWEFLSDLDITECLSEVDDVSKLKKLIPDIDIYKDIASINSSVTLQIKKKAVAILDQNISADILKSTLRNYTSEYWHKMIDALLDDASMKPMPNAIEELAKIIYTDVPNNSTSYALNEYTKRILSHVDTKHISSIFSDIRNVYCNGNKGITPNQFKTLEKALRNHGSLNDRTDDVVNKILKPVINDADCKTLILTSKDFYRSLIAAAVNIDEFKSSVQKTWKPEEYSQLGITPPESSDDKK
jgi:hypothetical protein